VQLAEAEGGSLRGGEADLEAMSEEERAIDARVRAEQVMLAERLLLLHIGCLCFLNGRTFACSTAADARVRAEQVLEGELARAENKKLEAQGTLGSLPPCVNS